MTLPLDPNAISAGAAAIAAAAAGWAAWTSARLVKIERRRDEAAQQAALVEQVQAVTIDVTTHAVPDQSRTGRTIATDLHITVRNGSARPLYRCSLAVTVDETGWGPQQIGSLGAGQTKTLMVRVLHKGPAANVLAELQFRDANAHHWQTNQHSTFSRVSESSQERWKERRREFEQRMLDETDPLLRGQIPEESAQVELQEWLAENTPQITP